MTTEFYNLTKQQLIDGEISLSIGWTNDGSWDEDNCPDMDAWLDCTETLEIEGIDADDNGYIYVSITDSSRGLEGKRGWMQSPDYHDFVD